MTANKKLRNDLISVFVALVILGILAAILFPVFSRSRENARRASSQSYLKQVQFAPDATESAAAPSAASDAARPQNASGGALPKTTPGSAMPRKIITTAEVSLVVEKLSPAQDKLLTLVRKHKGYIAETSVSGQSGTPRQGRWKARIPASAYDGFMAEIAKLGEVQTLTTGSSDVSEEYYDLEARLRNKRVEEKRLIEHLNRSTAKLEDILKVEKEISRVRGEIEQMEGRLRLLSNLTELTTVTVTIQEIKDYIPPAPPTFATQIARTFSSSLGGLLTFGKGVILALVGLAPWLIVLLLIGLPLWRIVRRRYASPREPNLQS